MLQATLKSLWARKLRLVMSALSIILGIAFVAGSLMFTRLLSSSFDEILKGAVGDVNVTSGSIEGLDFNEPGGGQVPLLTDADLDAVAAVDGVDIATGLVSSSQIFPLDKDGRLFQLPGAPGVATNWHETPAAGGLRGSYVVEGRAPEADDEMLLDPLSAERGGYVVGDTVEVSTPRDGIRSYTLVGTATYGSGSTAGASYLFFTLDEARAIAQAGRDGYYGLWITTDAGADPATVAAAVADVLPEGFVAETADQVTEDFKDQLDVGLGFVNVLLLVFAGIALLVATLLILNTFSILVAQRARELALLRAIGATRAQVRTSVLAEALIVGIIGASLGLLAGYGLAWGILGAMRAFGMGLGAAVPQITWREVAASFGVGIVITLIAAYLPALKASRTRPVEAMARASASGPEKLGGGAMIGIALIEVGIAAIVVAVFIDVASPLVWLGVGAALLLVGLVLAAAIIGRPLIWALGRGFRGGFGEVGKLAELNAVRQPRRTAATAATLMIGLALVTTVAIVAASTTTSIRESMSEDQRGDFTITPVAYQPFDAKVAERARGLDGVADVYEFWRGAVSYDGDTATLTGATDEGLSRASSLDYSGTLTADGGVEPAILSADFAAEHSLQLGQLVDLPSPAGTPVTVLVTGIHQGALGFGDVIVTPTAFATLGDATLVSNIVVFAADGADHEEVRAGLLKATEQVPTAVVADVQEFIDARVGQFNQLFSVIYALLALAVIISVLGIVNTLGLSVLERTREVGLLRAVGLTRPQLLRMVALESVMIAVLGAILGVVLGLVLGSGLVQLLRPQGIDRLAIPWWQLGVFVVLSAVIGVLASIGPARRAARLDVIDSIAAE